MNKRNPRHGNMPECKNERKSESSISDKVGLWSLPCVVILVLIACIAGYKMTTESFTPVIGMLSPALLVLLNIIKEAAVGKDEDIDHVERLQSEALRVELEKLRLAEDSRRFDKMIDDNDFSTELDIGGNRIVMSNKGASVVNKQEEVSDNSLPYSKRMKS